MNHQTSFTSLFFQYLDIAESVYAPQSVELATQEYLSLIDKLRTKVVASAEEKVDKIQILLDFFFTEAMFSQPNKHDRNLNSQLFSLLHVIQYRTGQQGLLSLVLADFSRALGFESDVLITPSPYLVRISVDDDAYVFIEPSTGYSYDWNEIEALYDADSVNTEEKVEAIEVETDENILLNIITLYKAVLIAENKFIPAFKICESLLFDEPDNPYLRRERGYLLEQMECKPQALEDYRYFVEKCPDDPIAKMLKLQLDDFNVSQQIIH